MPSPLPRSPDFTRSMREASATSSLWGASILFVVGMTVQAWLGPISIAPLFLVFVLYVFLMPKVLMRWFPSKSVIDFPIRSDHRDRLAEEGKAIIDAKDEVEREHWIKVIEDNASPYWNDRFGEAKGWCERRPSKDVSQRWRYTSELHNLMQDGRFSFD